MLRADSEVIRGLTKVCWTFGLQKPQSVCSPLLAGGAACSRRCWFHFCSHATIFFFQICSSLRGFSFQLSLSLWPSAFSVYFSVISSWTLCHRRLSRRPESCYKISVLPCSTLRPCRNLGSRHQFVQSGFQGRSYCRLFSVF